jgi:DNA ligase D-like protein (predicted 3'-phosphoesterase)
MSVTAREGLPVLSILARRGPLQDAIDAEWFAAGEAAGWIEKTAGTPSSSYSLAGRLVVSQSGWGLLEVPNALVRGLFAAMHEPGIELPPGPKDQFDAHISVFHKSEIEQLGGPEKINERGKVFRYQIGPIQTVDPAGWPEMSAVYFVRVMSPELKRLRVSYGLDPLPKGHNFHITIAVRRKGIHATGPVSKAASADAALGASLIAGAAAGSIGNIFLDRARHKKKDRDMLDAAISGAMLGAALGGIAHLGTHAAIGAVRKYSPRSFGTSLPEDALSHPHDPTTGRFTPTFRTTPVVRTPVSRIDFQSPVPSYDVMHVETPTLEGMISHNYKDAPGGFAGAVDRAIKAQGPIPGTTYGGTSFTAKDLAEPITVQHVLGLPPTLGGATMTEPLHSLDRGNRPLIFVRSNASPAIIEHELTHAALDILPGHSGAQMTPRQPSSQGDFEEFKAYTEHTSELIPRVADIKRQYVAAHPGEDVNTMEEAEKALRWWHDHQGRHAPPGGAKIETSHQQSWDFWERDHGPDDPFWDQVKRMMMQVVDVGKPGDHAKVAAAIAGIAKWGETTSTHTHTDPTGRTMDVHRLIALVAGRPTERLPLAEININRSRKTGFSPRRYAATDPTFPGILDEEGQLLDGRHRIARLRDAGESHGVFRRATAADLDAVTVPPVPVKAADFAPGLPSRSDLGPLDQLQAGQLLDYVVQRHAAQRAGLHHDIRFGNKDLGLFSWAAPKGVPAPGQKHLALQQPVHRHEYRDFQGEIPAGSYGAGTVKTYTKGQVLITGATPDGIHFTTAHERHPERFSLIRTGGKDSKNWLLLNTTPREPVPYEKVRYKNIPPEQVEPALKAMQEGDTAEAKIDGASQLVRLVGGHAEALSFRTSKQTGRPIFHTERLFGGRPKIPVPKHLEGSILKGEVYAARPDEGTGGRTGPQDVTTLLNSSIGRSLQLQKERGLTLRNMLYDVQQYGQTPIDPAVTPRHERQQMLEEILAHLPADKFHLPEPAHGPEAAQQLWDRIRSGKHPLTEEGIVLHPKVGIPQKMKLTDEHDVVLRGTFPGAGKRQATVGGFTYSHTPTGPVAGKVGTGLSDALLAEIARDPSAYVGRTARLGALQKLPSGALRNPVFLSLHEDYNAPTKAAGVLDDLKRAKAESDRKNYPGKHAILRRLVAAHPEHFAVDSTDGRFAGLTHLPTGFRIHAPRSLGLQATGTLPAAPSRKAAAAP